MRRSFAGTSLTETRLHALWVLHHGGAATQQALSHALGITPRSVSALVDALVGTGYAERRAHPTDRRAVLVTLTPAAQRTMARMAEDHRRLDQELVSAVDPADLEGFERGLEAVRNRLERLMRDESVDYSEIERDRAEPE
ncbi:MarR family transcriptional regulator [Leucobacter weissii]|uniref:MarR family transcriptional regulator n=2 Tax=Leucobacter weissii TaxID=1983706 RepID=A0A939MQ18_9MICO|nr:MarR family transcriptional regulator [Leucobacter weissii]MBO1902617.1 MarR family transcriptional regulator [Leucobacter weissii]